LPQAIISLAGQALRQRQAATFLCKKVLTALKNLRGGGQLGPGLAAPPHLGAYFAVFRRQQSQHAVGLAVIRRAQHDCLGGDGLGHGGIIAGPTAVDNFQSMAYNNSEIVPKKPQPKDVAQMHIHNRRYFKHIIIPLALAVGLFVTCLTAIPTHAEPADEYNLSAYTPDHRTKKRRNCNAK